MDISSLKIKKRYCQACDKYFYCTGVCKSKVRLRYINACYCKDCLNDYAIKKRKAKYNINSLTDCYIKSTDKWKQFLEILNA